MKFKKSNLDLLFFCFSFISILTFLGCASNVRHISVASNESAANVTNSFNYVHLYTTWFDGLFGDGRKEWDGLVSDNDLAIGLHPATKSEFDFKVRAYPSIATNFHDKTNFLYEIAKGIEATNQMEATSTKLETIPIMQRSKLAMAKANYTFLCRSGKVKGPIEGVYPINCDTYFVHYLADVHSDAETNLSGIVFHAVASMPETVDLKERQHLIKTMKLFIKNMILARDPKSPQIGMPTNVYDWMKDVQIQSGRPK